MSGGSYGCDHIGLFTNDADRMARFYGRIFGYRVQKDEVVSASLMRGIFGLSADCRLVKMARAGAPAVMIELFEPVGTAASRRRNGSVGYNHFGLSVGDRFAFVGALKRKKAPVIEVRRGEHRVFFTRDPDGNRIEIRE